MKKLPVILLFLFTLVGAYNNNTQAQVLLSIDTLINFPDTAILGQAYPVAIRVRNMGNTPYQGPLQIGLVSDSAFTYLYFSSNPTVVILPNDTLTFYTNLNGAQGFVFDSSVFRSGNNVVVVWPYSSQSFVTVDSLTTNVYVRYPTGFRDISFDKGVSLYPNPFENEINLTGAQIIDIERVRIFTLQGVKVVDGKFTNKRMLLDWLKPGCYLLDAEIKNGQHLYRKIIKK